MARLRRGRPARRLRARATALPLTGLAGALLLAAAPGGGEASPPLPAQTLRVSMLDVGQGDAILLQPSDASPVLVDTGPPDGGIATDLAQAGVERLAAVIVTHDQSDHAGGLAELLGTVPTGAVLHGAIGRTTAGLVDSAGVRRRPIAAGARIRAGRLRLEVLWPPRGMRGAAAEPNAASVVAVARWGRFAMLLSGDAEAEAVPVDPGPIDVLKVAHHGSEDAGLAALLARARPELALISAGEGNPFGHPSPATLATLAGSDVEVMRTDRDGAIWFDVRRGRLTLDREVESLDE